jgi:hypothetical protein
VVTVVGEPLPVRETVRRGGLVDSLAPPEAHDSPLAEEAADLLKVRFFYKRDIDKTEKCAIWSGARSETVSHMQPKSV